MTKPKGVKDLSFLTGLPAEELPKQFKKLSKTDLQNLLIAAIAEILQNRAVFMSRWEEFDKEHKRALEQNDALADDNNRLRNENEHLHKCLDAALLSRQRYVEFSGALSEALNADVVLLHLGVPFE